MSWVLHLGGGSYCSHRHSVQACNTVLCWHAEVPLRVRKAGSPVLECWHGDLDQQHS